MFDRITPMVKNLLIINIGVQILMMLTGNGIIYKFFAFYTPIIPSEGFVLNPSFKIWQVITYMFIHSYENWGHLISNMFGLFIFGSALETFMGSKKFLIYYLVCGIGAALINSVINVYELNSISSDVLALKESAEIPMVGASGAIFGILMAFGFLFPNVEMMLLFFPFPIKAKYFVAMYGVYELVQGTAGLQSGIAHFAHLGGLLTGFILLKFFGFSKRNYY
ncbi:MAG: rhomboid family intramembrane serine protease [Leadbetterella sp.]|nr:rhomboid family intramembrane serine protease [Leadbetterella sp.]